MNVQENTNPQEAASKIWDQLDAEDNGTATPPPAVERRSESANDDTHGSTAPAQKADAQVATDEVLSPREQLLMDKISGLESNFTQVQQRLRNAEGHIGGLNNQLKQAKQVTATGGEAPSAQEVRAAQGDPAAMASLKRDYPEFATAMGEVLNEQMSALEKRLLASRAPEQQTQPGVSADDIAQVRRTLMVEVKHPGWEDRVQTPEFHGWLTRQPREVQMLAASESPQDAVRLLDLHTESTRPQETSQRTQRLNSAAALPSGRQSGASVRQKPVEEMSKAELWRHLDELDRNKR